MSDAILPRMRSYHLIPGFPRLREWFGAVRRRARDRAELPYLDDRDLRDIGISRAMLAYELSKPFWRG